MSAAARPSLDIAVATAEQAPLWIFGVEAGDAIRELFVQRGIALLTASGYAPRPRDTSSWPTRSRCLRIAPSLTPVW
jgi:hypothetical protein